ncbi:MAG: FAD-binding protein [Pseudomonadota bacterium]
MTPASEAELAEAVATAASRGTALRIRGGGTRAGLGRGPVGEVLQTSGLSGISLYEPGALTIVAGAGTPLSDIQAALLAENQRLPFEPMDHRVLYRTNGSPTIGGVVAAGASGPRRIQAGACRDSLIGVRLVTGTGEVVKNGGRVMKNVTGYDLVKLLAGSHGTLGIITEVAFKVLPAPEAAATVTLSGLDEVQAVGALTAALGAPYEVSGAVHLPGDEAVTAVRVEGFEGSVAYRAERLTDILGAFGPVAVERDADRVAHFWERVRDLSALAEGEGDMWRISVRPSDGPRVVAALSHPPAVMDWGGGLVSIRPAAGTDVRAALSGIPGHATLLRAEEATKARFGVFEPEPAPLARISAGLRGTFDPKGILNPGLMAGPGADIAA